MMASLQTALNAIINWVKQSSVSSNPASGNMFMYFKSDGKLYKRDSSGTETEIGGTSGAVTRSGSTTDNHLAVWNGSSADSIKDGGVAPAAFTVDAAPSLVQTLAMTSVANGATVTLSSAPVSGNTLIAFVGTDNFACSSLVQTNVTWTKVIEELQVSGNFAPGSIWIGQVSGTGGTTITCNFAGNSLQGVSVIELSACDCDRSKSSARSGATLFSLDLTAWNAGGLYIHFFNTRAAADASPSPAAKWTDYTGSPYAISNMYGRVSFHNAYTASSISAYASAAGSSSGSFFMIHLK